MLDGKEQQVEKIPLFRNSKFFLHENCNNRGKIYI